MNYKKLFKNYLNEHFKDANFTIDEITENDKNVFCYLEADNDMDIPTLVIDKENNDVKSEIVPPFTDNTGEKTIWKNENSLKDEENPKSESEDTDMEAEQIRNLLKLYGAEDKEIENFMKDLYETKDEMKDEEEDFNYLDGDTMAKLKATKEGQDLIINAPKMAKDELKKAIMEYLSKQS